MVDHSVTRRTEYAKEVLKNLDYMKNKDVLMSNLMDPQYIVLDKGVSERVVVECKLAITAQLRRRSTCRRTRRIWPNAS
jgi:hypothetical protein